MRIFAYSNLILPPSIEELIMLRSPRRTLTVAIAAFVLVLAPAAAGVAPAAAAGTPAGDYIVTLSVRADVPAALQRHGVAASHRFDHVLNGFAATLTSRQLAALRADPQVIGVEANSVLRVSTTQLNPPSWGLDRIDQPDLPLSDSYTFNTTAAGVHAYIIDTGIDERHSQFGNRADQVFNSAGGPNRDCHGHGTHVAGTVGATDYGVAKEVNLYGVKVLNCAGSGSVASVVAGMDWVAANHESPAVANMSLGGGFSAAINTALDDLADSGVFVAVASGNSNADACDFSPASASNATTVNASDINDNRASFSNFGPCTHLYAPGVGITSTVPRNRTDTFSGTSMASPHVTGVAAMYKATFGDHSFSTIRSWLVNNATSGVISGNPPNTPNLLLFTNGL
jgi:subtilisin family serine protease